MKSQHKNTNLKYVDRTYFHDCCFCVQLGEEICRSVSNFWQILICLKLLYPPYVSSSLTFHLHFLPLIHQQRLAAAIESEGTTIHFLFLLCCSFYESLVMRVEYLSPIVRILYLFIVFFVCFCKFERDANVVFISKFQRVIRLESFAQFFLLFSDLLFNR